MSSCLFESRINLKKTLAGIIQRGKNASVTAAIISHIKKKGERFSLFNGTNIAMHALMFHHDTIIADTAKYVKQVMIIFDLLATD